MEWCEVRSVEGEDVSSECSVSMKYYIKYRASEKCEITCV